MAEFHGSARLTDGTRVALTAAEAKALWEACEAAEAQLAADMPTDDDALRAMGRAYERLRKLGWRDAIYCPKDGSSFDVIEAGSTGIHRCHYSGIWPDGHWWIESDGDLWPSRPILFRLDPDAEAVRQQKLADAAAAYTAEASAHA